MAERYDYRDNLNNSKESNSSSGNPASDPISTGIGKCLGGYGEYGDRDGKHIIDDTELYSKGLEERWRECVEVYVHDQLCLPCYKSKKCPRCDFCKVKHPDGKRVKGKEDKKHIKRMTQMYSARCRTWKCGGGQHDGLCVGCFEGSEICPRCGPDSKRR